MTSRSRRRKKFEPTEEHPDERWMASYMDMVTVLMCMFIVLFAMSSVDAKKFEQLKNSLATGFGAVDVGKVDTAEGFVVEPEDVNDEGQPVPVTDLELARQEVDELLAIQQAVSSRLDAVGLLETVEFEIDERGLSIRLIGAESFFYPDAADLTDQTVQVLKAVGPVIGQSSKEIAVEGHTAIVTAPNPRYWELSSSRATNVVRNLIEVNGVPEKRIRAVGYGSTRPLRTGSSPTELQANRRTDIVVISDAPEEVRALIEGVIKERTA